MEHRKKDRWQDFDWALGINRFSLRLIGAWPADQDKNSKSLQTVLRIPLMILLTFCGLILPQMYALKLAIEQLPLMMVTDNIMTSTGTFISCIKLFFIWRSTPVIDSALQDYLHPRSKLEEMTMYREAYRGRFINIADYSLMASCYLGFVILPTLGFNVRIINNVTDYGKHPLIVQSYYPYDYSKSPAYELTHLLQFITTTIVMMALTIPDDYFCALVLHASAQFEILGLRIETLGMAEGIKGRVDVKLLRDFIDRHLHLNKMVSAMEKSFEFVIAAQLFHMSMTVCCVGVQILLMLSNTSERPPHLQILAFSGAIFILLLHVFINCFVSENLESRSSELLFKIYSSRWYTLPCNKMRCLLPMMLIAKTPRQIRAAKILPMSMATYSSIVKSTAGYISMLVAVSGR